MLSQPFHSQLATIVPLKASIREMIQLQRNYRLSDELFWEIFNTRVLLNRDLNVDEYVQSLFAAADAIR